MSRRLDDDGGSSDAQTAFCVLAGSHEGRRLLLQGVKGVVVATITVLIIVDNDPGDYGTCTLVGISPHQ